MITREEVEHSQALIKEACAYLAKIDRHASAMQSKRLNYAFNHLEKAHEQMSTIKV